MPNKTIPKRSDGRKPDELRPVRITPNVLDNPYASAMAEFGRTKVLCTVSVEETVPKWMLAAKAAREVTGWITSEYAMLPGAGSRGRTTREGARGRITGRTAEIQRLIGRSLRSVVDLKALGPRTLWVDCDVLQADGGTRAAAVTGGFVALKLALERLQRDGTIPNLPSAQFVAAVSVGLLDGVALLDLNYEEDSAAEVDMNVVMTEKGRLVELQATGEAHPFTEAQMRHMLALARRGIRRLIEVQRAALTRAVRTSRRLPQPTRPMR